jgi:hypothetical protein
VVFDDKVCDGATGAICFNESLIELQMPVLKKNYLFLLPALLLFFIASINSGCKIYSFSGVSIADSIKTVKVDFIENRARYVNPQLSPRLTDRVKQKITNQSRLTQTNNDNAHLIISGYISSYDVSTSAITNGRVSNNRLTVAVHISVNNTLAGKTDEYDVSRNFEFSGTATLQSAENGLMDEMVRGLTDDIFNRIFSNW